MCELLIVYELCNDDKIEEANKKLINVVCSIKEFYDSCEDAYFINMKMPLKHIMLSCKVYVWKAYILKFSVHKEEFLKKILKVYCC